MLSIKRKLSSKSGASMLLAMVFLMFCLFIGGSVLAAATANGSRVEHLKNDQQAYLSQRSAMLLMADLLTGKNGKELQVMVTDVTKDNGTDDPTRTVTITCPALAVSEEPSYLQKLVFGIVAKKYTALFPLPEGSSVKFASNLKNPSIPSQSFEEACSGSITATLSFSSAENPQEAESFSYKFAQTDLTLTITSESGSIKLIMDGSISESNENIVTVGNITTTTKTTVIRWSKPVIEKGEAVLEGGAK